MRASVCFILLLALFLSSASRAQETAITQPRDMWPLCGGQAAPGTEQTPSEESQNAEEKPRRLFWIIPTYTVADVKSPSPLTTRGKWRLFVKDESDPFTFGWVALQAGIEQKTGAFSGYGTGAAGYGKRYGARMRRVIFDGRPDNLHWIWDTGLVEQINRNSDGLAAELESRITAEDGSTWAKGSIEDWVLEGHRLARTVAYADLGSENPAPIISTYAQQANPVIELQSEKAGVRLAYLLNEALR